MKESFKPAVLSVVSARPQRKEVRRFADECLRIAEAYLRRKLRDGTLDPQFFGLTLEDLALDCIADLFQRDEQGRFTELVAYFAPMRPVDKSDVVLVAATRRLVFSKVSEGLFRRYREADPGLAKLIRNLRYAISRTPAAREVRRDGTLWVLFGADHDHAASKAIMPPEFLEMRLFDFPLAGSDTRSIVRYVFRILHDHPSYKRAYPLTGLSIVIRSALERLKDQPEPGRQMLNRLYARDIRYFIEHSVRSVKEVVHAKYVAKKKIDHVTFTAYFDAVQEILESQAIADDPDHDSYFEHLKSRVSSLSYDAYRNQHRARFEYVVKKTREEFLSQISAHWK